MINYCYTAMNYKQRLSSFSISLPFHHHHQHHHQDTAATAAAAAVI